MSHKISEKVMQVFYSNYTYTLWQLVGIQNGYLVVNSFKEKESSAVLYIYYVADQTLRGPTLLIILCSNSCCCCSSTPPRGQNQEDAATAAKTRGHGAPQRVSRGCRGSQPSWPPENQYPPTPKSQGLDKEEKWRPEGWTKTKKCFIHHYINFTAPQMVNKMHSTKITLAKFQVRIGEGHQVKGG